MPYVDKLITYLLAIITGLLYEGAAPGLVAHIRVDCEQRWARVLQARLPFADIHK